MAGTINFFNEDVSLVIKNKIKLRSWIKETIHIEGYTLNELNFIFCSDLYLLDLNRQYLNHDTFTDIITFDNSQQDKHLTGDIFISYERVCENAAEFKASVTDELHRVIIHGTLHLLGYKDKKKAEKALMTSKEDFHLARRNFVK